MNFDVLELVQLALLGGVVGIDQTSLGQTMISRPLVAATLAGLLLGDPATGATVGAVLELFHLLVLPVGGARFPEPGPAACVGAAAATAVAPPGGLAVGVALGLVWAHLGGMTVTLLRRGNARLVPDPTAGEVTGAAVRRSHAGALAADFVRGALLTGVGGAVSLALFPALGAGWPLGGPGTAGLLLAAAALPVGAVIRMFGGWRRHRRVFLAGIAVGTVMAVAA